MLTRIMIIGGILLFPLGAWAFAAIENFEFFKNITFTDGGTFHYIDIDSEIESHSKKYLSDVRIFSDKGEEIKFLIKKEEDVYQETKRDVDLPILEQKGNQYIIDLNKEQEKEYLNSIFINTDSTDFRRVVDVQGSDLQEGPYFDINIEKNRGDVVYDLPEGYDLSIDFKYSNYKYLKITFTGDEGDFINQGFYRVENKTHVISGEKDFLETKGIESNLEGNNQKIILDTEKSNLFFDQVKFTFADERFERQYILYASDVYDAEIVSSGKRIDPEKEYWVKVSQGAFRKEIYTGDPVLNLKNNKRFYRLDILNGDNEKLKYNISVFEKFKRKMFFAHQGGGDMRVYYGSEQVVTPKYDIRFSDTDLQSAQQVSLSEEQKNQEYVKEKNEWSHNQWLIYILIGFVVFVLAFFVYKIIKESNAKTDRDGMQI